MVHINIRIKSALKQVILGDTISKVKLKKRAPAGIKKAVKKTEPSVPQIKHKETSFSGIPLGFKVLIFFYAFTIISILYSFYKYYSSTNGVILPSAFIFGKAYAGTPALLFYLSTIIILSFVIYDIINRGFWALWLALIYSLFNIVAGILSIFVTFQHSFLVVNTILINILVVWYLWYKRAFFFSRFDSNPIADRLFALAYIALYINMFVFTLLNASRIIVT